MKLKKIFTLLIALIVSFSLVACKKCKNHVDANDDLKCDHCGKDYDDGPESTSCTSHIDNNGDTLCDNCGSSMAQAGVYEPKWELNSTGFNGNGMTIKIKCLPVSEFDPFDANYSGDSQEIKMRHQQLVQQAYNIKIKYVAWEDSEQWGPVRAQAVIDNFTNKYYLEQDVYVVNISSGWIPGIVKSGALAELGSLRKGEVVEGILSKFDGKYKQNSTVNEVLSASNKLYGISTGSPTPDHFIFYNIDLVERANAEDPAELWLKGEWTVSKLAEWAEKTQKALPSDHYALDIGYPEFAIGLVASSGNRFVSLNPQRVNFLDDNITSCFKTIQTLYSSGYYNDHGVSDVTGEFTEGRSVLTSGQFWFIKASDRFNAKVNGLRIGIVPYPAADGDNIVVETSSDIEEALIGANGEALMKDGEYVTGLDLENAAFRVPYTSTSCFSILDHAGGKNGINAEIVASILVDLYAGVGKDPNQTQEITEEQGFRIYLESLFDREVDVDVVMSVYDRTYFEIFEAVSMTAGGNSHYGPNGFWPICAALCKSTDDPYTKLSEIYEPYRQAMIDMGYNPLP